LFEVRGLHRKRRGTATRKVAGRDEVLLSYDGLDGKTRCTKLTFDPPPSRLSAGSASYRLHLAPGEVKPLFVAVARDRKELRPMPCLRGLLASPRGMRTASREDTTVETSNALFNEILCRSAADLFMLTTKTP